jgi:hypothetical protein
MSARSDGRREQLERLHGLLDFAGRFHRYSFDNQLLIAVQHDHAYRMGRVSEPQPSYVAGFRTWKALGRSVEKGQRGYAILAPVASRSRLARGADGEVRPLARGEQVAEDEESIRGRVTLRGFTVAHVWDVAQTSGAPIPEPPPPRLLEGGAPDGLAHRLTAFLSHRGYEVSSVAGADVIAGANGITDFAARTVQVRADMDEAARVKTLAHEAGHVLLHDPTVEPGVTALGLGHRGRAEVEAESVAYVLTSAYGMDPSGYSLQYVTSWAGTDRPAEVVRATARRVVSAAHEVLGSLDPQRATGGQPPGVAQAVERQVAERPLRVGPGRPSEAIGV